MSYGFSRFLESRRFVRSLPKRMLRNAMDGSIQHLAVSTENSLEVKRLASKDGIIVNGEVLSIRTA